MDSQYAIANLERYFADFPTHATASKITLVMARAKALAQHGVFASSSIEAIMDDSLLALDFCETVDNDAEHIQIAREAIFYAEQLGG